MDIGGNYQYNHLSQINFVHDVSFNKVSILVTFTFEGDTKHTEVETLFKVIWSPLSHHSLVSVWFLCIVKLVIVQNIYEIFSTRC
jgi:hypothetical protein